MAIQLNEGTIETVPVKVTDANGVLTTLDSASPKFSVYPYILSGIELVIDHGSPIVSNVDAGNDGMTMLCLIDTTTGGGWDTGQYALLVTFNAGDDSPILGPIDIFLR